MKSLVCGFLLIAASSFAQVPTPAVPTSADVLVLPATGDKDTLAPIAFRTTAIAPTAATCNLLASAPGPTPLINPATVEIDDLFNAGRVCRLAMPTGLPNGTGYRVVVIFNATCDGVPCTPRLRSLVGVPFFNLAGIQVSPAAPTNPVVRP